MKLVMLIMVCCCVLNCEAQNWERIGLHYGNPADEQRREREAKESAKKAAAKYLQDSAEGKFVRSVQGTNYFVLRSTNWITIPLENERIRFSRPDGNRVVFELEKLHVVSFGPHISDGGYSGYEWEREVAVINYPRTNLMAGDSVPPMRVMRSTTTESGLAVYDYGQLPVVKTNNPSDASLTNNTPRTAGK